jgi:hypothetical protein
VARVHVAALVELRPEFDDEVEGVGVAGGGLVLEEDLGRLGLGFGRGGGGEGVGKDDEVAEENRVVCDTTADPKVVDTRRECDFRGFEGAGTEDDCVGGVGPLDLVDQVETVYAGRAIVVIRIKRDVPGGVVEADRERFSLWA